MNKDIREVDKNVTAQAVNEEGYVLYEARCGKFAVEGFAFLEENDYEFTRLPKSKYPAIRQNLLNFAVHNSGGRIRFMTKSKHLLIKATLAHNTDLNHFPRAAMNGIDVYLGHGAQKKFAKNIAADFGSFTLEGEVDLSRFTCGNMTEVTLYLPLYNQVKELYIGLKEELDILKPVAYTYQKPIVFYGSSIVQGACPCRAGNSYVNMLTRFLDADYYNMGFSGQAMGEEVIANILAGIDMSLFVMDYDHNAPTPDHLEYTHYNFYRIVREKNRKLPILLITKPDVWRMEDELRRQIIYNTYRKAKENGDENIYFVDGKNFYGDFAREACSVDNLHPNDLGCFRMASYLYPIVKYILDGKEEECCLE